VIFFGSYQARWTHMIDGGAKNKKIDKYVLNMGRASYNAVCNLLYKHAGSFLCTRQAYVHKKATLLLILYIDA
jgi:hypothetical protein